MLIDSINDLLQKRPVILQLLRFAAIGAINTALDFIILNFITTYLGIDKGTSLGLLNAIGFIAAVIQSYFWNKAWAFAESKQVSLFQNAFRLIMVGGLGFVAFVAVLLGSGYEASSIFYLLVLAAFLISELVLWIGFKLSLDRSQNAGSQFVTFIIISLIGLLINSLIIVLASNVISPYLESSIAPGIIKNVAKIIATGVSLIWNFVGYKLFVFKK
jgi:putative flippase GtrA